MHGLCQTGRGTGTQGGNHSHKDTNKFGQENPPGGNPGLSRCPPPCAGRTQGCEGASAASILARRTPKSGLVRDSIDV